MSSGQTYPLRQMRLAAGLSIRELEAATGINRGRLSIIERGVSPTDAEARLLLVAMAEASRTHDVSPLIGSGDA